MKHLQYFYKMKNDNEPVTLLRKKNINVNMKILIMILCNDTVVALRPPDEHRAVCSNTQKINRPYYFPFQFSHLTFVSAFLHWCRTAYSIFALLTVHMSLAALLHFHSLRIMRLNRMSVIIENKYLNAQVTSLTILPKVIQLNLVPTHLWQLASSSGFHGSF